MVGGVHESAGIGLHLTALNPTSPLGIARGTGAERLCHSGHELMALASWDENTAALVHEDPTLLRALDMVAPGTTLREGIDNVIHASTGALIVIGEPEEISFLFSGGLSLDVDYTPGVLYQVAKMDGAIVLDPEANRALARLLPLHDRPAARDQAPEPTPAA